MDENEEKEGVTKSEDGGLLKPHIFTLTIPQVDGCSNLLINVRWSQKIIYKDGEFILNVPYSFPENESENQGSSFCIHYFLQTLAMISKGHHDASYDADSTEDRMQMWFSKASSSILASIVIDGLDDMEIYPSTIPDLNSERPLIISGRFKGNFPEIPKVKGIIADMSNFTIDIEVQHVNDIPLEKVLAKKQIESYTTQAWFSKDKELEEKVAKISLETGTVSEYTNMILLKTEPQDKPSKSGKKQMRLANAVVCAAFKLVLESTTNPRLC
ncbi:hypothetical protein L1987_59817 [Smallanthus sonchifolius]|uniref:Uncharacterized protein n=1 Tax=Smallanthus sonchifolius TaxID=185202 RepID=A0ACB9D757_9ASTR|nr:hypothetical protein L1987_59817 [Smallanthus sonchifolius]